MLGGVCGGLAAYLKIDPSMVRIIFALLILGVSEQASWFISFYGLCFLQNPWSQISEKDFSVILITV